MSCALPRALEFAGMRWAIRADYRQVLTILQAFDDPELTDAEKAYVCLHNLYVDFGQIDPGDYGEAYRAAVEFIDCGAEGGGGARMMDWEQDAPLIFAAVNRVAGREVRADAFLHWWTFLGLFMEIRDSTFATVLMLRQKKARGKPLEPWERDFWQKNAGVCRLRPRLTEAEQAEKARLELVLGGGDYGED